MKEAGIPRRVDELGRIVLPIEMRRAMDIEEHTCLDIFYENDTIVLRRHADTCIFCGDAADLTFMGKSLCSRCVDRLREED